jgi:hypothetical protein
MSYGQVAGRDEAGQPPVAESICDGSCIAHNEDVRDIRDTDTDMLLPTCNKRLVGYVVDASTVATDFRRSGAVGGAEPTHVSVSRSNIRWRLRKYACPVERDLAVSHLAGGRGRTAARDRGCFSTELWA